MANLAQRLQKYYTELVDEEGTYPIIIAVHSNPFELQGNILEQKIDPEDFLEKLKATYTILEKSNVQIEKAKVFFLVDFLVPCLSIEDTISDYFKLLYEEYIEDLKKIVDSKMKAEFYKVLPPEVQEFDMSELGDEEGFCIYFLTLAFSLKIGEDKNGNKVFI